ncbi:hypothetical protein THARTR1_03911 [Trichoderma harzianum]|uniref:Uncharacterized protein n=1 Tax=Trichoderma harzianum TaxID=5544 RepID=A0A2K0UDW4_TRIHA|nr:hypothetical protein THARTR1_03911 [Trichoderma harzianum]
MARLNPSAITTAPSQEPFTLQPLIRQMLSTRRCTSGSIFIVEGIDVMPVPAATPADDDSHAVRLVLGDGELCIQALLHPDMFYLVEKRDVFVGCCVRLGDFVMRFEEPEGDGQNLVDQGDEEEDAREERDKDDEKGMVYLIVNELETAGWNESYMAMWRRHERGKDAAGAEDAEQPAVVTGKLSTDEQLAGENQGTASEEAQTTPKASRPRRGVVRFADQQASPSVQTPTTARFQDKGKAETPRPLDENDDDDEDDEDLENAFEAFEARTFPIRRATPKKPAASNDARETAAASDKPQQQQQPIALPRDWHDQQTPLKLTTLRLIPHLPYAQNWSVNVLAIVASLSPVEPSHLAPGKQRTARIADPSTAKQVHLTVFLDPDGFTPRVGSAVLLVGVKNHRFDGGSLKKYASDGDGRWWFEDPWDMSWLDVAGIKSWWQGVEEYHDRPG